MTQQERYKIYIEEICKYCKNPDCENAKGIVIFADKDTIYTRCVDYVTDRKIKKGFWLPAGFNKFKRKKY